MPATASAKPRSWSGIALDEAMRGRKVLHVSLDKTVDHMREFYDEIFMDLAHSAHLEDLATERLEMERNRMLHTYAGKSFTIHKLRHSINFLKEYAHFDPACLILEGFDFERATLEDIEALPATRRRFQRRDVDVCRHAPRRSRRTSTASPNRLRSSPPRSRSSFRWRTTAMACNFRS